MKTLQEIFGRRYRQDEPLSRHSTLRIGGPAAHWFEVHSIAELVRIGQVFEQVPIQVVGLGSNSLFDDVGIDGAVVRLKGELASWSIEEGDERSALVRVGAGAVNAHLVRGLLREGWVDMEFLTLIPGTFGGAVALNAGTKEQELSTILESVELLIPGEPRMVRMKRDDLKMTYRHAELPAGAIVVSGVIQVERGDVEEASARVQLDKSRRDRTQPYKLASVGSTFANPEGDFAGRLIEAVGLKGHRIGGACISELHANFFINEESATCDDFLRLMALARCRVRQDFGVELRPEVHFVGFDGYQRLLGFEEEFTCS